MATAAHASRCRTAFQTPVALPPPPRLAGARRAARAGSRCSTASLHPEPAAQLAAVRGVGVRLGAAHVVVHVGRCDLAAELGGSLAAGSSRATESAPPGERDEDGLSDEVGEAATKAAEAVRRPSDHGADEWTRTTDTGLMRPLLYR